MRDNTHFFYDPTDNEDIHPWGNHVELKIDEDFNNLDTTSCCYLVADQMFDTMDETMAMAFLGNSFSPEVQAYLDGDFDHFINNTEMQTPVPDHLKRVVPAIVDFEKLRKYFLYRPKEIVMKTLENTTQLAQAALHVQTRKTNCQY